jgi:hypothetical protein
MDGLLLENILEPRHLVSDESARLLVLQIVDLPLVVLYLLVNVLQLLLDDVGRGLLLDQLVLLLYRQLLLLLVQHLVYLDDLVLQLTVALFQLLDVLRPGWKIAYLMSSDSFSF